MGSINGVILTPLKIIEGASGNIWHALKHDEESFAGFGEAYFPIDLSQPLTTDIGPERRPASCLKPQANTVLSKIGKCAPRLPLPSRSLGQNSL